MEEKDLELLEFPLIRERLAGFTSFSVSRVLALNLKPLSDFEKVNLLLRQSAEARHLLTLEPGFSIGGIIDVREAVRMASRGKVLEPRNLLEIQETLTSTRQLRDSLKTSPGEFPLLWNIAKEMVELRQLEKNISGCIAPNGELLDSASLGLAAVRQQFRQEREQLFQHLKATMQSPRGRKIVQQPIITKRQGRYVIPIKIEYRRGIKGIVHDVSNSEATVFIEPLTTVESGNALRELEAEESREIERILRDLSVEVGRYEAEISNSVDLMAELDLALAKARYAMKARATEPIITAFGQKRNTTGDGQMSILKLVEARHPLLYEKAVPLSVEIGRDIKILVITGPNTGGKTVALKTIGLLSLMAQAGIPIPALSESRIPIFDSVFADIGDEQSIEQTLSTFSWHTGNIVRIIAGATQKSLVLLDELGTNTDPAEGSALARAILLHFLSRGTMTVATTHYSDLKAFAHVTSGLQNASLDFEQVTLKPTYHLTVGVPGGSNAIATASRLGLLSEIIASARSMLSKGAKELETLLAGLVVEKNELEVIKQELKRDRDEVEQLKLKLENEIQRLAVEERRVVQETRDRVVTEAAALHHQIQTAVSALRKERTKERAEQAKQVMAAVRERLKSEIWQTKPDSKTQSQSEDEGTITVGDTVRLKETNLLAKVISISEERGQVEVQAGQIKITLSLDSVEMATPPSTEAVSSPPLIKRRPRKSPISNELKLLGKRADEVEPALDVYINDAFLANLSQVRIVHGIGTGTVRKIARHFLASHLLVKSSRPGGKGEGGDGVTVVQL